MGGKTTCNEQYTDACRRWYPYVIISIDFSRQKRIMDKQLKRKYIDCIENIAHC